MPSFPPPLAMLRAFEAAERLGSVSRAAEEIGRTHGAVSKQIKALEQDLGTPLFDRVGTGIRANPNGQRLAVLVREALGQLGDGYEMLRREMRAPSLHVSCSASFAMGWLVPHLPSFGRVHPDISIRLSMTSAREMRDEREADLIILWDRSAYPPSDQARAIRLGAAHFGIVAAPGYPVTSGANGTLHAERKILHDHTTRAWTQWEALSGQHLEARGTSSFPHTHLCLGAAVAGMGVAIAEERLATADLEGGRLTRIAEFVEFPDGFAVIPHRSKSPTTYGNMFIEWFGNELS